MAYVDETYKDLIRLINTKGDWNKDKEVRAKYRDGTPAYAKEYFGHMVTFDKDHQPLLGIKDTRYEKAVLELFWIHFMHSNKVEDLRKLGVSIWDEWEREDGTIGKAYGYVAGKKVREVEGFNFTQLQYALDRISRGKNHRELIISLWDLENLDDMSLRPCVYQFQLYSDGKCLNMSVNQRSADVALGVPFNWIQYWVLLQWCATVLSLDVGKLVWNFGVLHYYDRHEEKLLKLLDDDSIYPEPKVSVSSFEDVMDLFMASSAFNPEQIKELYSVDCYEHGEFVRFEVAE